MVNCLQSREWADSRAVLGRWVAIQTYAYETRVLSTDLNAHNPHEVERLDKLLTSEKDFWKRTSTWMGFVTNFWRRRMQMERGDPSNGFTKNTYAIGYEAIVWPRLTLPRIRRSATSHFASLLLTPTFFAFTLHSYTLWESDVFHVLSYFSVSLFV